jgi:hypothetical protein
MPESVERAAPTTQLKAPMFKNLNIYRIASSWMPESTAMEVQLLNAQFVPCTATQDKSVGWVPPRNEANGALVESVACQRILRLRIETKSVPGSVVQKKAQEAAEHNRMVSDSIVREIRVRYAAGEDGTALAAEFGLPMQRVYRFIHGETRSSAGGPIQKGCLRGKKAAGRLLDGVEHNGFPA